MAQQINVNEQTKGTLGVNKGGTGGTTSAMARTNLDVPSNSEAVHIAGNETITGTKTFSNNDTYFGDSSKSFADIGNLGTNNEIYIDARSNTYSTVSLKLRSKSTGQIELMTNNIPRVYIDGTGNVGVGTLSPTATLDVDGTVRLRTGAGAGKVLTSDASGNATWQTSSGGGGTFSGVLCTATFLVPSTTLTLVPFTTETYDTDSYHDNVTNNTRFVIPSTALAGKYRMTGNMQITTGLTLDVRVIIRKNGSTTVCEERFLGSQTGASCSITCDELTVNGDYYELMIYYGTSASGNFRFSMQRLG